MQPNKEGSATPAIQHQWTLTQGSSFDINGLCPGLDYQYVIVVCTFTHDTSIQRRRLYGTGLT